MSVSLFLSRVSEALELESDQQIPDAWLKIDRLSQGLVSRYLARERGAPKASDKTSSWVILRPFVPNSDRLYAIWNSSETLKNSDLEALAKLSSHCEVEASAFSTAEHKVLRATWADFQEWVP